MSALHDRELVEYFADRPELLAVADAVAATQARRRRRPRRPLLAVPAGVAAVVAVAVLSPWERGGPSAVERALAAVGTAPVIHAVVESTRPWDVVVDVETGAERPRLFRTEYWYDGERRLLHTRLLVDGVQITEIVETPTRAYSDLGTYPNRGDVAPTLDPALAGFATQYREALASGKAEVVGEATVDGRRAERIRIELDNGWVEEVHVDAETHEPLRFTVRPPLRRSGGPLVRFVGGRPPEYRVVAIESLPRDPSFFAPPPLSPPRPTSGAHGTEEITLDAASRVLGRAPLWLGPAYDGRPLESVQLLRGRVEWTDGRHTEGLSVTISYGDVTVSQAVDVAGSYLVGFNDGGEPEPPPGFVAVRDPRTAALGKDAPRGLDRPAGAELRVDGVYVQLHAPDRGALLEAARKLEPVP